MTDRPPFPPAVLEALRKGNKLEAIKLLRQASKTGLVEAKALVDAVQGAKAAGGPAAGARAAAPHARSPSVGAAARATPGPPVPGYVPHSESGLSPGEVPRAGAHFWWALVLVLGAVVVFALI